MNNNKQSILIVDDDEHFRFLVRECFEEEGFQIVEAENGIQALELAGTYSPDVILLDITMPEMDGFETCNKIRQNPKFKKTPVIMLTGMEDLKSIRTAYDIGVTDYINKPDIWPWPILKHRVKSILEENRTLNTSQLNLKRLDHIEKTTEIGYWQWNCQDDVFEFNTKWAEILHIKDDQTLNYKNDFLKRINLNDIFTFNNLIEKVINTGHSFLIQIRAKQGDGLYSDTFIWIEATCAILEWDNHRQQAKQICGTIREIIRPEQPESLLDLERRFTQEILRQRDLYQSVISTMEDAVIVTDDLKQISIMNQAAEQLFSIKSKEQINPDINHYIPDYETILSPLVSSKNTEDNQANEIKKHYQLTGKTANGTAIQLNCHVSRFEWDKSEYCSIVIRNNV